MVLRRALLIAFTNSRKPAIVISLLLSFSGCTSEPDSVAESTIDQGGATIVEAPRRPSAIKRQSLRLIHWLTELTTNIIRTVFRLSKFRRSCRLR